MKHKYKVTARTPSKQEVHTEVLLSKKDDDAAREQGLENLRWFWDLPMVHVSTEYLGEVEK
jgi:hypothetical protein